MNKIQAALLSMGLLTSASSFGVYHWAIMSIDNQSDYFVVIENSSGEFSESVQSLPSTLGCIAGQFKGPTPGPDSLDVKCHQYVIPPKTRIKLNNYLIPYDTHGLVRMTAWVPSAAQPITYAKPSLFLQDHDYSVCYYQTPRPESVTSRTLTIPQPTKIPNMGTPGGSNDVPTDVVINNGEFVVHSYPIPWHWTGN